MEPSSFIDSLHRKYCDDSTDYEDIVIGESGVKKKVEMIGFDLIQLNLQQLTFLEVILLNNFNIDRFGEVGPGFKLKNLKELDIADNKLTSWTDVARICSLAPKLRELVLTGNPLVLSDQLDDEHRQSLQNIKNLIVGNLNYCWEDVEKLLNLFPQGLSKLNLFQNRICEIHLHDTAQLENLEDLVLFGNPIKSWDEILKLGTLKKLKYLDVSNCKLKTIHLGGDESSSLNKTPLFPALKHLNVRSNSIGDWRSIAQLNRLGSLNALMLKRNPIFDLDKYYVVFNYIVSKIQNLTILDAESITPESRSDSEKYYFRTVYQAYSDCENCPNQRQQFLQENPTFLDLLEKFGAPVVAKKLTKEEKIKKNFIKLSVVGPNDKRIQKQVPLSMNVADLKSVLRRLFKLDVDDFQLKITCEEYEHFMDNSDDINSYGIVEERDIVQIVTV